MRIIVVGVCVNNVDPKGIGRIRFKSFGSYVSEIENSVKYEDWDNNDPFLATPFLPLHINILPQIGQSIKLLKYDTAKESQNVEYVPGPFSSPVDLENQTFLQQNRDNTYGGAVVKDIKNIRGKNGKFINNKIEPSLIKIGDIGIKGNYGTDLILTNNGFQIRGGVLPDKLNRNKDDFFYPQLSNKIARFNLKKFQKELLLKTEKIDVEYLPIGRLNYILEYDVIYDNGSPELINIYIYKVINTYGNVFDTNVFNNETDFDNLNIKNCLKLINTENNNLPTITKEINGDVSVGISFIRDFISRLVNNTYEKYLPNLFDSIVCPLYFRPKKSLKNNPLGQIFINRVQYRDRNGNGLIFNSSVTEPYPQKKQIEKKLLTPVNNSTEQTFSNLSADKIYLTSTTTNGTDNVKKINFKTLDPYELTQEDYLQNIEPNTYALVRGDILLEIIKTLYDTFDSHIHQINKRPIIGTDPNRQKLDSLMKTLEDDLLNKSIRIN